MTGDSAPDPRQAVVAVTWCRLLRNGPICPHPCADCKRADALLTDDERRRLTDSGDRHDC